MTDDETRPEPEAESAPPQPAPQLLEDDSPLHGLFRAFRIFLVPFIGSWALAWIGSESELLWIYYTGLGGVGVSLVVLFVWLIR